MVKELAISKKINVTADLSCVTLKKKRAKIMAHIPYYNEDEKDEKEEKKKK